MITSAQIQHYKSIAEASLSLRPINVVVGPNGSGKSNLMDALYFLHDCFVNDVDTAVNRRHGIDSIRQWSRRKPYNITLDLKFRNEAGEGGYKVIISSNRGTFRVLGETGWWRGPSPIHRGSDRNVKHVYSSFRRSPRGDMSFSGDENDKMPIGLTRISPQELFMQYVGARFTPTPAIYFRHIYNELSSFAKYNIYPNVLRSPQIISKETMLNEEGSNLSSILKRLNNDKRYTRHKEDLIESLRTIMPNIASIEVKSAAGFYAPVIKVMENNNDIHEFNLSQISDGTLRTLGLLTAFYQPAAPNKIGIEEPELMIHPGALQPIKDAMHSFVSEERRKGRQIFITTHSPTFIDLFDPEDIVWARLQDGLTECDHIRKRQLDIIKRQLFSTGELLLAEGLH
jgi:predicted ATPase